MHELLWLPAFLISSSLGVLYDFLYKKVFPNDFVRHKLYLEKGSYIVFQLILNTLSASIIALRILRGVTFYKLQMLIRAAVQIGLMILIYQILSNLNT